MHNNYFFLKSLAKQLNKCLSRSVLAQAYSQDADELVLTFLQHEKEFNLKCHFKQSEGYLSFPERLNKARNNFADLFDEIVGETVQTVQVSVFDRSFRIYFTNQKCLLIKLHGKYTNVILFQENTVVNVFKNQLSKDWEHPLNWYQKEPVDKQTWLQAGEERFSLLPWLGDLKKMLPFGSPQQNADQQWASIEAMIAMVEQHGFEVEENNGFTIVPSKLPQTEPVSPIELCNQLTYLIFTRGEKSKLLGIIKQLLAQALKRAENELKELTSRLETLSENPYETKANNLMANLHLLKNDEPLSRIANVYTGEQMEVKLPPNKTWIVYANHLYQKAKNTVLEAKVLENRKLQAEERLLFLLAQEPNEQVSIQQLRLLEKQLLPKQKAGLEEIMPYHLIAFAGFDILVGKNSNANDRLLKEFSKPNDLWLHARELAGSHVIIKNPGKAKVPQEVLNRAAELAAYYSKGKNLSNCPVIVTERKYVRKFKGALAGQVKVEREKTLFAQPKAI